MNPVLQVVVTVLASFAALFNGLILFVLRDMRERIVRLENRAMHEHSYNVGTFRSRPR